MFGLIDTQDIQDTWDSNEDALFLYFSKYQSGLDTTTVRLVCCCYNNIMHIAKIGPNNCCGVTIILALKCHFGFSLLPILRNCVWWCWLLKEIHSSLNIRLKLVKYMNVLSCFAGFSFWHQFQSNLTNTKHIHLQYNNVSMIMMMMMMMMMIIIIILVVPFFFFSI